MILFVLGCGFHGEFYFILFFWDRVIDGEMNWFGLMLIFFFDQWRLLGWFSLGYVWLGWKQGGWKIWKIKYGEKWHFSLFSWGDKTREIENRGENFPFEHTFFLSFQFERKMKREKCWKMHFTQIPLI